MTKLKGKYSVKVPDSSDLEMIISIWWLKMKTGLRQEELRVALVSEDVSTLMRDEAPSIITFALEDSPLPVIQSR